jgi:hypothetical protein
VNERIACEATIVLGPLELTSQATKQLQQQSDTEVSFITHLLNDSNSASTLMGASNPKVTMRE